MLATCCSYWHGETSSGCRGWWGLVATRRRGCTRLFSSSRTRGSSSSQAQQTAVSSCRSLPTAEEITAHCPAYVSQYSSDLHMLVRLLSRHYSPGKVLDLSIQLPGAGTDLPRENIPSMDLDSFLYGIVYCVGWEGERVGASCYKHCWRLGGMLLARLWWNMEAIRCTGLHGLDINLTMMLGKTFESTAVTSERL